MCLFVFATDTEQRIRPICILHAVHTYCSLRNNACLHSASTSSTLVGGTGAFNNSGIWCNDTCRLETQHGNHKRRICVAIPGGCDGDGDHGVTWCTHIGTPNAYVWVCWAWVIWLRQYYSCRLSVSCNKLSFYATIQCAVPATTLRYLLILIQHLGVTECPVWAWTHNVRLMQAGNIMAISSIRVPLPS